MGPGVLEHSKSVSHSEHCEEVYGVLLTLREADSGAREGIPKGDLEVAEKEAQRLLAQEDTAMDGETPRDPQPRYPWEPWELEGPVSGVLGLTATGSAIGPARVGVKMDDGAH